MIFKTTFDSFKLYKILPKYLLIVIKYSLDFLKHYWNVFKNFDTEKPGFLHLIIIIIILVFLLIILVWKGYSQIKTRYIHTNYQTIFKMFISSAVVFQKSRFLIHIQDIDLST